MKLISLAQLRVVSVTGYTLPPGHDGAGGGGGGRGGGLGGKEGGDGNRGWRGPQSAQSVPYWQSGYSAPGPPSSHQPSEA
jgi:hypothetical protein